jgi:hypothetical protein
MEVRAWGRAREEGPPRAQQWAPPAPTRREGPGRRRRKARAVAGSARREGDGTEAAVKLGWRLLSEFVHGQVDGR